MTSLRPTPASMAAYAAKDQRRKDMAAETDFYAELDALITRWRREGVNVGEIIADMEGMLEGLKTETAP